MDFIKLSQELSESEERVGSSSIPTSLGTLRYVGDGYGRAAYVLDKWIIKLPFDDNGLCQSIEQHRIYEDAKDDYHFLLPVTFFCHVFSAEPHVATLGKSDEIETVFDWMLIAGYSEDEVDALEASVDHFIEKYDMLISDIKKADSWGIFEKRLVCYDYGMTHKLYKQIHPDHVMSFTDDDLREIQRMIDFE